jgi:hypothetical protein
VIEVVVSATVPNKGNTLTNVDESLACFALEKKLEITVCIRRVGKAYFDNSK